jgi:nitrite reductase (NO-forming)
MASYPARNPIPYRPGADDYGRESGVTTKIVAIMLGVALSLLAIASVVVMQAADTARDEARAATAPAPPAASHDHATDHAATGGGGPSDAAAPAQSYAGQVAENAEELAAAHEPYDATLPPLQDGDVVNVKMVAKDKVVEIAPGVKYRIWAFDASGGAPGPIVHVREGQTVNFTIENGGSIPHSMDFHAARIAPNEAFKDLAPGESFSFSFRADDPGVYMYHCGTKPVLAHIANGMYGAIVVRPAGLPPADNEYALVSSEWYLDGAGLDEPASLSLEKARAMTPDWVTFNGYASQYVHHPLTAEPGETTRFWVVSAGPTLDTNFHVVGTVFERAWVNGDMTSEPQQGVQTVLVPAGGGAVFDVTIDEEGTYPFVSHAFAHVELGQVGILKVGSPKTTMSH